MIYRIFRFASEGSLRKGSLQRFGNGWECHSDERQERDQFSFLMCRATLVLAGVSLCLEGLGSKAQTPVVVLIGNGLVDSFATRQQL